MTNTVAEMRRFLGFTQYAGNGCVEWTGWRTKNGYGGFDKRVGEKKIKIGAHRQSWQFANGTEVPPGMHVCHTCDNRLCINPEHLWVGTREQNMEDMVAKGRSCFGMKNGAARISAADIAALKADRQAGASISTLQEKYGISRAHTYRVITNERRNNG